MDRAAWRAYPYVLAPNDPELTFPAAEGDQGAESNTYYVAGRLRGRATQREWAFLVIFTFNDVRQRLRADFYTFALFDLATGAYGTYSEYDLPRPPRIRRALQAVGRARPARRRLRVAHGTSRWTTRRDANGVLQPFAYHVSLVGYDARGPPHGGRPRPRHA